MGKAPEVQFYDFGLIRIDGVKYEHDVIIFPDRVFSPWQRQTGHYLEPDDIPEEVFSAKPDLVIIGNGSSQVLKINPKVNKLFELKGIELIIQRTNLAYQTYNEMKNSKKTIAMLHLTC